MLKVVEFVIMSHCSENSEIPWFYISISVITPVKIINQNGRSYAVPCAVRTVSVQNDNHGF